MVTITWLEVWGQHMHVVEFGIFGQSRNNSHIAKVKSIKQETNLMSNLNIHIYLIKVEI